MFAAATLLGGALALWPHGVSAVEVYKDGRKEAPKQLNDPLPPQAMPKENIPPDRSVPPRGTAEGMGNETHATKTPGDDDPSDGVDEPGRDPIPGMPRRDPGKNR